MVPSGDTSTTLGRPGFPYALNILDSGSTSVAIVNPCDFQNSRTRPIFSFAFDPCSKAFTPRTATGNFSAAAHRESASVSFNALQHGTHHVAQKSSTTTEPRRSCRAIFFPSKFSSSKSGAKDPAASREELRSVRFSTALREPSVNVIIAFEPLKTCGEKVPFTWTRNPSGALGGLTSNDTVLKK